MFNPFTEVADGDTTDVRPGRLPAGGLRPQAWDSRGTRQRKFE